MKTSASPAAGQSRSIAQRLLASRAVARILRNLYRWTHSRALRHNQVLWRCCASSAMARKAGALRHALGRHARPDRLLQHPASRGRCRPPDPERSVGGRYRLLRTGPARGDGRERFDRAAAQPSAPAFRLLRDVGRRLRVAPPRPGRRRAGARPAAVRHAGGATRDRAAVFSGRHSLPHRGLRRSAPARVPAPRAAGTIGEDAA